MAAGLLDLIHLADLDNSVTVRVLGRYMPGVLPWHDFLRAEVLVESEFVTARLALCLAQLDLDAWERALGVLAEGRGVRWLDTGRTPELGIELTGQGHEAAVTVRDVPQSGVSVRVPLALHDGWLADQRERLGLVRRAYPCEVVETSPNAYAWRRPVA